MLTDEWHATVKVDRNDPTFFSASIDLLSLISDFRHLQVVQAMPRAASLFWKRLILRELVQMPRASADLTVMYLCTYSCKLTTHTCTRI